MKLLNKMSIWFLGMIFLVTPVTMVISRNNIKKHLDQAEIARMTAVNDHVYNQLLAGDVPDQYTHGRAITVSLYNGKMPQERVQTIKSSNIKDDLVENECRITVSSFYPYGNQIYKISSYNYVLKSNELFKDMLNTVLWKMLIMIAVIVLTARLLSRILLSPLHRSMRIIKHFDLKKKDSKIELPHTSTTEFKELNDFLKRMTTRAKADYAAVKEFSENASHELQTPLAVVRSKLDLLSQTDIDGKQAELIGDMQTAIERLSHINRSLVLLTKLENHEYNASAHIKFCTITRNVLAMYEDWINLKEIKLQTHFEKNVSLKIHPALAEMLISNLLSNAIRYNLEEGGEMQVELTAGHFKVRNTGHPPILPTEELFRRFKKTNQCNDSIGLGLAIVKQICEVNDFTVTYNFEDGWHQLDVCFASVKPATIAGPTLDVATGKVAFS
ncbi:HAMP domain-containing sensor histidine kinase [Chitinophaga sp. Cy-1792]|uniref:sensor histidine kinase n=1 Tax=Chitinophaga sp. Cy-1792 TaxID=2608339 RepID=UPI00141E4B12|nr:HAMP domain-containing sensor histidine kinase [Chitinophaga sp. Cy-1792]NIG56526.1 HAMP domain-containing histidine kinase [Chitinophaga sp. Cy-1792]